MKLMRSENAKDFDVSRSGAIACVGADLIQDHVAFDWSLTNAAMLSRRPSAGIQTKLLESGSNMSQTPRRRFTGGQREVQRFG
jgi:hypothetical protein